MKAFDKKRAAVGAIALTALTAIFSLGCSSRANDATIVDFETCVKGTSEALGVKVQKTFELVSLSKDAGYAVMSFGTAETPQMVVFGYDQGRYHRDVVKRNIDTPQARSLEMVVKNCAEKNLNMSYVRE